MKFKIVKDYVYNKNNKKILINKAIIDSKDFIADRFIFIEDINKGSRILAYQDTGYMIISASRNKYSAEENLKRAKELESDLIRYSLGFRPSIGGYIEESSNSEDGIAVTELSYIVPKRKEMSDEEFLKIALELCKKYEQDTVLVSLPSLNNGKPSYLKANGNIDMEFNHLHFVSENDDPKYYTKLRKEGTPKFVLSDSNTFTKRDVAGNSYLFVLSNLSHKDIADNLGKWKIVPMPMHDTKDLKHYSQGEFLPGFKGRFLRYDK